MYISKFQLFNYKSFLDSGLLEFTPGINIIVGQNNSGKTALLEALTLNFDNAPHRSIKTLETPDSKIGSESRAEIVLHLDKGELRTLLHRIPTRIGVPDPPTSRYYEDPNDAIDAKANDVYKAVKQFNVFLDKYDSVELSLTLSISSQLVENGIITERLNFDLYLPSPKQYKSNQYSFTEIQQRSDRKFTPDFMYESEEDLPENPHHYWRYFEGSVEETIVYKIFNLFRNRIYRFHAERLNVHSCPLGESSELKPDASNLPEVLYVLQNLNPPRFSRFNHYLSIVFPQIKGVSVRPDNSTLEIRVWSIEAAKHEREDLAFPLSACGTGIGQVLAILYVVLTSQDPRTIIIDEPQSFLHPGAAKKLVEILREFPQHQYFIATHSPMIIAAANPSTIVKLQYEDCETKVSVMNSEDVKEQRSLLAELGVSLSDVFGADNILWVEGPTEERCFPLILEEVAKKPLRGTQILAIKNTGDLEGKRGHIIFDIYDKLSGGKSLFPPAIGFVLDKEGRSERDIEDLKKRRQNEENLKRTSQNGEDLKRTSQNGIEFLDRRMYENYLLHPEAIAVVLNDVFNEHDDLREKHITATEVDARLKEKRQEGCYLLKEEQGKELSDDDWVRKVHAGNLLEDIFSNFSEKRVSFKSSKPKYSEKITEWLVEKEPHHLSELADFLQKVLNQGEKFLRSESSTS